jgi:hypothetical protein
LRTAGMEVRAPRPKASTSQHAAIVMEGPADPRAKPARVTRGRVGSCFWVRCVCGGGVYRHRGSVELVPLGESFVKMVALVSSFRSCQTCKWTHVYTTSQ